MSFIPIFIEKIVELMGLNSRTKLLQFSLADNVSCDPKIGIPCPYLGVVDEFWHTSLDVPGTIDYKLMSQFTALSALYAYSLANAGKDEALWIAEFLAGYKIAQIQKGYKSTKELEYFSFISTNQVKSIAGINNSSETMDTIEAVITKINDVVEIAKSIVVEKENKEQSGEKPQTSIIPIRRFTGPLSFLDIPLDERRKSRINVWNPVIQKALFWIDGKRNLEEIIRLTELEHGSSISWLSSALQTLFENRLLLEVITLERLVYDLKKVGLKRGDKVGVHSSLKSLGHVVGGAETVIKALLAVIGPDGTLLMPLFNNPAPQIDLRTAPCRLGAIPETFRKYPGVLRSHNATHSVGVIGADAEYVAAGHEKGTQLGVDSPFHRLAKMGGWILHLGTDFKSSSIIHVAEAIAQVPYLDVTYPGYDISIEYFVEDGSKRIMEPKETPGDAVTFIKVQAEMERRGRLIKGKIGMADSILVKGTDILNIAVEMLQKDPAVLLCDNKDCPVCPNSKKLVRCE